MSGMRRGRTIDELERRARLGRRHALAAPAPTVEAATEAVVALHSSDPITVHLSARARSGAIPADVERALYDDRTLVRLHSIRRTLWVAPTALEPALRVAGAHPLVAPARRKLVAAVAERGDIADPEAWLDEVAAAVGVALADAGAEGISAAALGEVVPGLGTKVTYGGGRWAAEVTVGSRLLTILGFEGRLVRSRPLGTWVSGQYRYVIGPADPARDPDPAAARAAVIDAYVRRFGPVTEADVRWWTGWTATQVRAALTANDAVAVETAGGAAWVSADDVDPVADPDPWIALLPGLDPTTMGWKERGWYLGDLGPVLFDRNGNAGPTVWADGRVVGGWGQRPDGSIATDLRVDVGASTAASITEEAERLATWFAGVVATFRFRTPLERALVAGTDLP